MRNCPKGFPFALKISDVTPINDAHNNALYLKYRALASQKNNFIFGGRLAEYTYYDMDKVVRAALDKAKEHLSI